MTTVIAEPGTTWRRDLGRAFALVDAVAEAGADEIKFQWCSDPERLARRRDAGNYLTSYYDLRWNEAWHAQLAERCRSRGIAYACTVYLPEDVSAIAPFTSHFKVAAFETSADDLLAVYVEAMRGNEKPLVVSLGLGATVNDVDHVRGDEIEAGRFIYLRCVSAYPTPIDDLRLSQLVTQQLDGLSDHTAAADPDSLSVGALAVAAGARWLERHVCLDDTPASHPDRAVSLLPWQLAEYVARVRVAERALGDAHMTGSMPSEAGMLRYRAKPEA